jgi:predicted NBD/HSP70 family sugar kinase
MKHLTQKSIKENNIHLVFSALRSKDKISRIAISKKTGLSVMTVGKILDVLIKAGMVIEEKDVVPGPGRKPGTLSVLKQGRSVLILDLVGYIFRFGFLNLHFELQGDWLEYEYNHSCSYEENLVQALDFFNETAYSPIVKQQLLGVGVCVPGPYYHEKDIVINELIPELDKVQLKAILKDYFGNMPIYIDQDVSHSARYMGLYESKAKYIFYAFVGDGVGGAAYYNGALLPSEHNYSGEFGQFKMQDGKTLEAHISTANLNKVLPGFSARSRKFTLQADNDACIHYIKKVIEYLADAFCNITWLLDPQLIILESLYLSLYPSFIRELNDVFAHAMNDRRKEYLPHIIGFTQGGSSYKGAAQAVMEKYLESLV